MAYNFDIGYKKSADHANADADALSHLPQALVDNKEKDGSVFCFSHMEELSICARDIEKTTLKDAVLSKVYGYTINEWLNYVQDEALRHYPQPTVRLYWGTSIMSTQVSVA